MSTADSASIIIVLSILYSSQEVS